MNRYRTFIFAAATLSAAQWGYACGDGTTEPPTPPQPTTVTVTSATNRMSALGATVQLSAEVRDQNGQVLAGATVAWASDNAPVATVDGSGLVTATGNGTATITASAGGASGEAVVTVLQSPDSVAVLPAEATIGALGDTLRLAAEAFDANGRAVAGAEFSWESSDDAVATVNGSGLVTAASNGTATITASAGGASGDAVMTVMQSPDSVAVLPAEVTIGALGDTLRLAAEAFDANGRAVAGAEFSWESSDDAVAMVDGSGLVTAAGNGTATITASAGGASGEAVVTVMQSPGSVAVLPAEATIGALGDTLRLAAEAFDANGRAVAGAEFSWESSDDAVATVDGSGLVTAAGNGTATITASAGGASGEAVVTVMQSPDSVAVLPAEATIGALGDTLRLAAEAFDANGRAVAGAEFSWESSDDAVATVDSSGLVTAAGNGTATITASAGGASGEAVVTVMQEVSAVAVTPEADTIAPGDTLRLAAEAYDANGQRVAGAAFAWSSSDASVATVDGSGLVTGVGEGMARIAAAVGDIRATSQITVENPDQAALVALYEATDGLHWKRSDNWLTDAPLGGWRGVSVDGFGRVTDLHLDRNDLSGPIPAELGNLASLRTLDLGFNALTGPIPPELGNLTRLQVLSLWYNTFSGTIPPELGNLAKLERLWLESNALSGPIPPELGNLTSLKNLRLGRNALSGPIPASLANLPNLRTLTLPGGVCVPDDLRTWAVALRLSVFPCSEGRLLPLALMREDGNGLSLALPDDLREPSAVTVSDPSVVAVSVADGWLELVPRGRGSAEVEVVPAGGGDAGIAGVEVRAAAGTFGIDIVMDRPAPITYPEALTTAADWWSSVLDGTEWPDRRPTCFNDRATALADELLIHARVDPDTEHGGYARTCFRRDGHRAALDPGGGAVFVAPSSGFPSLVRHEIGHLLGLVQWGPETGLATEGEQYLYFVGTRAVEAFRSRGGDPGLPGVPFDGVHWLGRPDLRDFMGKGGSDGVISAAALADAGYTVDMTKATTPLRSPANAQAAVDHSGDVVPPEHSRLPRDESLGAGPPR